MAKQYEPSFCCCECGGEELRVTVMENGGILHAWLECSECGNMEKCGGNIELTKVGRTVHLVDKDGAETPAVEVPAKYAVDILDKSVAAMRREEALRVLGVRRAVEGAGAIMNNGDFYMHVGFFANELRSIYKKNHPEEFDD